MTSPRPSVPGTTGELGPALESVFRELHAIRELLEERRKPFYTVDEVARIVGRNPYTVRSWIKAAKVRATRVQGSGPKGRLLISRDEIDRLVSAGRAANASGYGMTGTPEPEPAATSHLRA